LISKRSIFFLTLVLMPFLIAACSDTSSTLGQYHEGRILLLNVMQIERSDELRYSTIDTSDVIRKWRIQPAKEGNELLLMRMRLENHVAMNAVVVADAQAAVLEGFFQDEYRPIDVSETVFLDQRGEGDSSVTLEGGECVNHARVVVNAGSSVQWLNIGDTDSAIQFAPGVTTGLGGDLLPLAPAETVSTRFDQPGTFSYQCSVGEGKPQPAQVLVEEADSVRKQQEMIILFLEGSFNLPKNTAIDGWMVFEVPEGTEIKTLRWRAGDSITVRF
jgi:plastocyanin